MFTTTFYDETLYWDGCKMPIPLISGINIVFVAFNCLCFSLLNVLWTILIGYFIFTPKFFIAFLGVIASHCFATGIVNI